MTIPNETSRPRKWDQLYRPPQAPAHPCGATKCPMEDFDWSKVALPSPRLGSLAGMAEARKWGEALRDDFQAYKAGRLAWSEIDPGCVLHGPPGTGKTTFAKALANSCFVKLVTSSFGEWQSAGEGHLGTLTAAMTEAFKRARAAAPCIFFIDELDSIPSRRSSGQLAHYWNAAVNHLLKLLDGIRDMPGVVIVGACNHPELLDPALVRSGRFDRMIAIALPELEDLPQIIRYHLKGDAESIGDLSPVAPFCVGMSGADIERVVREARRLARRSGRPIRREDLVAVIEAEAPTMTHAERRRIAIHEAGHAVAILALQPLTKVTASIVSRKDSGGRVTFRLPSQTVLTRDTLTNILIVLLCGRAAEEVVLGSATAGAGGNAGSDLAQATSLAVKAVATLGLSSEEPIVWYGPSEHGLLTYPAPVVAEAKKALSHAYNGALELTKLTKAAVEEVAEALLSRRALDHRALRHLVHPHFAAIKGGGAVDTKG